MILVGATLASFVIGVLFTLNQNVSYRGELAIHQLNSSELSGFDAWNKAISVENFKIGPPIPSRSASVDPLSYAVVTSDDIFERFKSSYLRGSALNSALTQHSKAVKDFSGDDEQRRLLLNSLRSTPSLRNWKMGKSG